MQQIKWETFERLAQNFLYPLSNDIKTNPVLICFPIEEVFWRYCKEKEGIEEKDFVGFATEMFQHVKFLQEYVDSIPTIVREFQLYKSSIPTFGAAILNLTMSKVLLVKNTFGNWSFPMGKISQYEDEISCAVREVKEETGLNLYGEINMTEYLECIYKKRRCKVFVIRYTESLPVASSCPYEVEELRWFQIEHLPWHLGDELCLQQRRGHPSIKFRRVVPFMKQLLTWIKNEQLYEKSLTSQETRLMKSLGLPTEFTKPPHL